MIIFVAKGMKLFILEINVCLVTKSEKYKNLHDIISFEERE